MKEGQGAVGAVIPEVMNVATVMMSSVLAIATASLVAQATSGLGDDPLRFDQLIDTAFVNHDVAFLDAAMVDDASLSHSGNTVVWTKPQWLNAAKTRKLLARRVDAVEIEQHDDIIETRGHIQVKTTEPDPLLAEYHLYYVRRYRHMPMGWQFAAHRTLREVDGPLASAGDVRDVRIVGMVNGPEPAAIAFRAGYGVTLPHPVREVGPNYTSEAMRAKVAGEVTIECVVRPDGTVGEVQVSRSLDSTFGLDREALRAARQWRFDPGTRNGEPVPVLVSIDMTFKLAS